MTNFNERLNEALCNHKGRVLTYHELYRKQHHNPHRLDEDLAHADAVAKQSLTSLIKDLVAEAQPDFDNMDNYNRSFLEAMFKAFERNLLKALEEICQPR